MSIIQAVFLGIIQGVTEFLPISSSGHLIISEKLFGLSSNNFSFDVSIHIGTLIALLIYFRDDLWQFISKWRQHRALIISLIIATLPAVIVGALAQGWVENHTRSVLLVCVDLALIGLIMIWADRVASNTKHSQIDNPSALKIGAAQCLALIPGVSRSASTILAGRLLGYDYRTVTRFSFLLAIPVTFGASIKVVTSDSGLSLWEQHPAVALAGCIAALLAGLVSIKFMLDKIEKIGLRWFGIYRVVSAVLLSLLVIKGVV